MATTNTYDVVLEKVGNQQLKTTKALCSALGLGLAAAKGMVDKAPTTVAKGLDKDKALALKKELEALGNTVSIPGMETKTEAPATKKTTTTKKQTTKKSAPSSSKAATPSNDDFDAIFGGDTIKKEATTPSKSKSAAKPKSKATASKSAASNDDFDEIFGNSTPKTEIKAQEKAPKVKIERVEFDNGDVYEGEMVNGLRHGKGKYTWANGDFYEGEWAKGWRCGFGVYKSYSKNEKDGSTYLSYSYEGEWKESKKHGQGIAKKYKIYPLFGTSFLTWSHEGGYANGDMHGHGIYKEWNVPGDTGRVHEGEWVNNRRQGRFVWEYEPSVTGKKYIDFYDQGSSVVFGIDYDPSIKTLEDAKRVKAENDAKRDRVIAERRAREAAQSRTSTASAAPSGSSHAALRQQIADAKVRGTILTEWESIDPNAFDERTSSEVDGMLVDGVSRIIRAEITGGYAYLKPINDTTTIHLFITDDYIRENYTHNNKFTRKEYATRPDGTGFFKKEMYLDKDDKQIGYAFAFEAGAAQGVYTLEDCLTLPNEKWQYYFALDPDGN